MKYYSNTNSKTKKWIICVILLCFLIIYIITYLLFFQMNLLNFKWIIAHNGVVWSGKVSSQTTIDWLNNRYNIIIDVSKIGKYIKIRNDGGIILDMNVLWILIGVVLLTLTCLFILKFTKTIHYDCFTFSLTLLVTYIIFVFSDLMPHWESKEDTARTIILISIICISLFVFFIIFNNIFNRIILNSKDSFAIKNEYTDDIDSQETKDKLNKLLQETKKNEYIEL